MGGKGSGFTREKRLVNQQLGRRGNQPLPPAGDSYSIPNHSGISSHPEALETFVEVAGDTMTGPLKFSDLGRITWTKITANSVTATGFTAVGQVVADLQTANDGNIYTATEVAGGGNNIIVDFVSVEAFSWVKILGSYAGSSTHGIYIELWNWSSSGWDQFACFQKHFTEAGALMCNADFFVPDDANYIGTGGSAGQVRIRFNHSAATVNNHIMYLDEVSLQQ